MKLELFIMETCPYCQKVLSAIRRSGRKDVELHDINKSSDDYKKLLKVGGLDQVPCLFIDGKPMYESGDIISWLAANPQKSGGAW